MSKHKVIYYNINQDLKYEAELLEKWEVEDIELIEIKNKLPLKAVYIQDAAGLLIDYDMISNDLLEELPNLKIIALQSIGYNNIDTEAATKNNTCVTNIPGFCVEEVALHTIGLMLDLVRKISFYDRSVKAGFWDPFMGEKTYRLSGKTIGLVFFGAIPQAMMPILLALQMNVIVYAPTKSDQMVESLGAKKVQSLEELMTQSDFVSIHTPLSAETKGMISEKMIQLMKPSAYLINTARGTILDEKALMRALEEHRIAGAGLDVLEDEEKHDSPLSKMSNVLVTPHAAYLSEDALYEGRRRALEQVVMRLHNKVTPTHLVNKACKII